MSLVVSEATRVQFPPVCSALRIWHCHKLEMRLQFWSLALPYGNSICCGHSSRKRNYCLDFVREETEGLRNELRPHIEATRPLTFLSFWLQMQCSFYPPPQRHVITMWQFGSLSTPLRSWSFSLIKMPLSFIQSCSDPSAWKSNSCFAIVICGDS